MLNRYEFNWVRKFFSGSKNNFEQFCGIKSFSISSTNQNVRRFNLFHKLRAAQFQSYILIYIIYIRSLHQIAWNPYLRKNDIHHLITIYSLFRHWTRNKTFRIWIQRTTFQMFIFISYVMVWVINNKSCIWIK